MTIMNYDMKKIDPKDLQRDDIIIFKTTKLRADSDILPKMNEGQIRTVGRIVRVHDRYVDVAQVPNYKKNIKNPDMWLYYENYDLYKIK